MCPFCALCCCTSSLRSKCLSLPRCRCSASVRCRTTQTNSWCSVTSAQNGEGCGCAGAHAAAAASAGATSSSSSGGVRTAYSPALAALDAGSIAAEVWAQEYLLVQNSPLAWQGSRSACPALLVCMPHHHMFQCQTATSQAGSPTRACSLAAPSHKPLSSSVPPNQTLLHPAVHAPAGTTLSACARLAKP